jgi:hypothetical protein
MFLRLLGVVESTWCGDDGVKGWLMMSWRTPGVVIKVVIV